MTELQLRALAALQTPHKSARQCIETGRLLSQVKTALVNSGGLWRDWLSANGVQRQTAQNYLRIFNSFADAGENQTLMQLNYGQLTELTTLCRREAFRPSAEAAEFIRRLERQGVDVSKLPVRKLRRYVELFELFGIHRVEDELDAELNGLFSAKKIPAARVKTISESTL